VWVHRTKTGRIVYSKPSKPFTWRDVARIARKGAPAPAWYEFREVANLVKANFWCSLRLTEVVTGRLWPAFQELTRGDVQDLLNANLDLTRILKDEATRSDWGL